jgi:hypothetical protein
VVLGLVMFRIGNDNHTTFNFGVSRSRRDHISEAACGGTR